MRPSGITTFLYAFAIILINIDFGHSEEASSYSNHFRGSHQGYHYPQKYIRQESGSNEIVSEDAITRLFNEIREQQRIEAAKNYSDRDILLSNNTHEEKNDGHEQEFSYNKNDRFGPSNWKNINPQCGGSNQSPIAINVKNASIRENSEPFVIDGLDLIPETIDVENNGHSLKLTFKYPNDQKIRMSGGPLKNPYILDNVHFHWGANSSGSEHVINGQRYAAEMHMVTYNSLFDSVASAAADSKGLAVLGILYEYDKFYVGKDNPWVKFITKITKAHSSYTETNWVFSLRDLIKEADLRGLLSYKGSLTTVPCSENVLWMLSTRPILIKQHELYELRKLKNAKQRRILENYRPLQKTNGRSVTAYKYY